MIYVYTNRESGTNSYLLGSPSSDAAIMIDPGSFDGAVLRCIEDNGRHVSHILVTRPRAFHIDGIRTIKRIYDAQIIAPCRSLLSYDCTLIGDNQSLELDGFEVKTIAMPDHTRDSVVYVVDGMLFAGEVMSAGLVDVSASPYGRALLIETIRKTILTLPPDTVIFSSFGPPSTVGVERALSPDCLLAPPAAPP
ncbi:MAG: hypothetical protein EA384_02080 [Spirochaetaceae bacterium]|nr:MAG: hypothetical protein EA384_02080 [Spirochaetaceae bacterium]